MRRRYPIPTVDDVLHTMNGSKIFSKLDLKWGYHQLELSPESREITTFATPDGLFRYQRLLFGVCSASEQYQHEIASVLAGIEGAENISDDIVVHGPDTETHDKWLHQTIQRLQECGLTLNAEKCLFNMNRFGVYGHVAFGERDWSYRRSSQSSIRSEGTGECHGCTQFPGFGQLQ